VTLTNGATSVAAGLFERAGIRDRFEQLLSVEEARVWKPAPGSYGYALEQCKVTPSAALVVAIQLKQSGKESLVNVAERA